MKVIEATVENVVFANEDTGYGVVHAVAGRKCFMMVGPLAFVREGEMLEVSGDWMTHPIYGEQFKAETCKPSLPNYPEAVIRYLSSGLIKGVGEVTATRIVDALGGNALDKIYNNPDALSGIRGISSEKAALIRKTISQKRNEQEQMVFLQSLRIPKNLIVKITACYGSGAETFIRKQPYRLIRDIEGIGFKTADRIGQELGIAPDDIQRLRYGVLYTLDTASGQEGHTCLPYNVLLERASELLSTDYKPLQNSIRELLMDREIVITRREDVEYCYSALLYRAEIEAAQRLCILNKAMPIILFSDTDELMNRLAGEKGILLSTQQKDAILGALDHSVAIITGGPGTGKTTILQFIIRLLREAGQQVELAAPTGRATKRMQEASGFDAKTIHRLLEYSRGEDGEAEATFQRNMDNPLDCDCLVLDEMSMVDIQLLMQVVRALRVGSRLILVGDADQLPSVGAGNVLRDIIDSEVFFTANLTEVYRQTEESLIIRNAHRINRGEMPVLSGGKGFYFESHKNPASLLQSLKDMIHHRVPSFIHCAPLSDIQVMAPLKKGELGVNNLNIVLQEAFNPGAPGKKELRVGENILREGDKVMQIRNDYSREWRSADGEGMGVYNGDIGFIRQILMVERQFSVLFDDGKLANYDFQQAEDLMLAYAISVHKSQGCEFPVVLLPLFQGNRRIMTRNLLYTAVTRASKMVVLLGKKNVITQMVNNNSIIRRYSGLVDFLREYNEVI